MKHHRWVRGTLVAILQVLPALTLAQSTQPKIPRQQLQVTWKKIVLDRSFRSEGVAVADINKDGKLDIVVGDIWYKAPDWKVRVIRKDRVFEPLGKGKCYGCFAADINGDGWPDVIVIPNPGEAI